MREDKSWFVHGNGESEGVRGFAQEVKRGAAVNYLVGAAILEEKPPVDLGSENGPDSLKTKPDIVKFLKDSFAYVHKAVGTINDGNLLSPIKSPFAEGRTHRPAIATSIVWHDSE